MANDNRLSDVEHCADGSRRVVLYIPYTWLQNNVTAIKIGPYLLDHTIRWQEGKFKSSMQLLCALTNHDEQLLRQLRQVDADRVLAVFMDMLPGFIANAIRNGQMPSEATPALADAFGGDTFAEPEPGLDERDPFDADLATGTTG